MGHFGCIYRSITEDVDVARSQRALVFCDQLAQHQRQDAAVVHVLNLGFVVDTRAGGEGRRVSIIGDGPHLDLLTRLERVETMDRVPLFAGEAELLSILAGPALQGQDGHAEPARAVVWAERLLDL